MNNIVSLTHQIWYVNWQYMKESEKKSYVTFEPHAFFVVKRFPFASFNFSCCKQHFLCLKYKICEAISKKGSRLNIKWHSTTFYLFGYQEYAIFKLDFEKIYVTSSQAIHFIEKSCFWLCVGSSDHAVRRWPFLSLKTNVRLEQNFDRRNEYKIEPTSCRV